MGCQRDEAQRSKAVVCPASRSQGSNPRDQRPVQIQYLCRSADRRPREARVQAFVKVSIFNK